MSAQQVVRLADCLLDELERSPRPRSVASWAIHYLARKSEQKFYVVDTVTDPLVQVEMLMRYTISAVKMAYADNKEEDDIRDAVLDALVQLMEMIPAQGLDLRATTVMKAGRAAVAAATRR